MREHEIVGCMLAALKRELRNSWQWLPVLRLGDQVADDEDLGPVRHGEVLFHPDPSCPIDRNPQLTGQRARAHASRPEDGAGGDAFIPDLDEVLAQIRNRRSGSHLDAQTL